MAGNKTLPQIYAANPIATIGNTDLVYVSSGASDAAIDGADMIAQFSALASGVTSVALSAPAIFTVGGSPVTSTGTLALSLATQSANKVFAGPTTGSDATPTFRSLVSADIPSPTMYALFGHLDGNTNALAMGVSIDGITFEPIGNGIPWLPPAGSVRDPSAFFYAPTGEWIISYTHGDPGVGDFYYSTLGLCKTRDGVTFEYIGEITFTGTGITPTIAWNGSMFVDDRDPTAIRYYLTALVMDGTASRENPGVGWVEFTDPGGDWTTVSAYTAFRATNSNFSPSRGLNDVAIRREGSTFHLFVDGNETAISGDADNGILHATSTSLFTGYSALACIFSIDDMQAVVPSATGVEGGIPNLDRDGRPRLYLQPTFGAMMYTGADTWTGAYDAPVQINWPQPLFIGNGDIVPLDTADKQQLALSMRSQWGMRLDATFGETLIQATRLFGENNALYINCDPTANGLQSTDQLWMLSRSSGAGAQDISTEVNGIISVYGGGIYSSSSGNPNVTIVTSGVNGYSILRFQNTTRYSELYLDPTDGGVKLQTNAGSTIQLLSISTTGTITPVGGIVFPTSAAAVPSGAWYDNAGVLTKKP